MLREFPDSFVPLFCESKKAKFPTTFLQSFPAINQTKNSPMSFCRSAGRTIGFNVSQPRETWRQPLQNGPLFGLKLPRSDQRLSRRKQRGGHRLAHRRGRHSNTKIVTTFYNPVRVKNIRRQAEFRFQRVRFQIEFLGPH